MPKTSLLIHNQNNWWRDWQQFWAVFHKLYRRDDLENLIGWAQRKKLAGQARYYSSLLADVEVDLNRSALRQRTLSIWAHALYSVCRFLKRPHKRYSRGSASIYNKH
ncbi:MAG: hypothetical protein M5U05_18770 [Anaerolineales bacterium]|nr:hypothetical protein [Anaerolineales bacterium]